MELAKSLLKMEVEPIVFSPYERTRISKEGVKIVNVPTLFSALKIENMLYHISRRVYYDKALQRLVIKGSMKLAAGRLGTSSNLRELFRKFDLDIIQAEQDNAALLLLSLRAKLDLPVILDLHGIWPEELLAAQTVRMNSKEWKDLQNLMKHIVCNVDLTVALSDAMREYVLSHYEIDTYKVAVVPPGGRVFVQEYRERPMPPRVVYAGIVSYRKHVDLFVRSMPHIKSGVPNAELYITNRGDLLAHIRKLAQRLNMHPTYFWFKNFEETLKFLSSCHVGVLPSTNDISARISMPSKLFDYMSAGLPVVANDVGGWTSIIKDNNCGRVTSDNPREFAKDILEMLNAPEEMDKCGRKGIELIKNQYNWDVSAALLAQSYERLR